MKRLTDDEIKKISALAAKQAEERTALACRFANERGDMEERHAAERAAIGLGAPNGSTPLEGAGSTGLEAGRGARATGR